MDDNDFVMDALFSEVKRLNADLQEEDAETEPDGKCREDDGCPTENAVLRREWRKLTEQLAAVTAERDAAVDGMKIIADTYREKNCDDGICGLCKFDADHGLDGDANECPGFETDDCFEWRGPQAGEGGQNA